MGSPNEFREAQLSTLRFLADKAQQLDFARNVHYDDYASEIYFWWLDVFDPEDEVFTAAFSAAELAALSRFADLYREFDRRLPERRRTMEELHATPE